MFTSAGNNTNFDKLWAGNDMKYDIAVIYYQNDEDVFDRYKEISVFAEKRKGSKFQNFHYLYTTYPDIIQKYDRFFVMDDDIVINVADINKMFEVSQEYDLKICGPSFDEHSKPTWNVMHNNDSCKMAFTNFVEVNVPLFNKHALDSFMEYYDPSLVGWGIDFLYVWCNGPSSKTSFAIVHDVTCTNPTETDKNVDKREIANASGFEERINTWKQYSHRIGCPFSFNMINHSFVGP